jgi:soluble epoxide hydrolase / lipid-phosphate phosphatase
MLPRGGAVIWRTVLWHPELISHVFSVCTPYDVPKETFRSTEDLVNGPAPQFGYQLHLASGEVEKKITSKAQLRQFLKGMYGAKSADGKQVFSPEKGVLFGSLQGLENVPAVLITENVMDSGLDQYQPADFKH